MTITVKTIGKWLAILAAIASAVIGSLGTGTLPTSVRTALVAAGAVIVVIERYLTTTPTSPASAPKGTNKSSSTSSSTTSSSATS